MKEITRLFGTLCYSHHNLWGESIERVELLINVNMHDGVGLTPYTFHTGLPTPKFLEQVVTFASRSLTSCERNYSTIELECLSIIFALKKFRSFILGQHITIKTDHRSLMFLKQAKLSGTPLSVDASRKNELVSIDIYGPLPVSGKK